MIETISELRQAVRRIRGGSTAAAAEGAATDAADVATDAADAHSNTGAAIALVPTMGALHDGHLALVRRARELGEVVVSIFVNPLQFSPTEDLARYPRTLQADLAVLAAEGIHTVFVPTATELYPAGRPQTLVDAGEIGNRYDGAARPGHFDGMLTVVAKLLNVVQPDYALFGQKDAQQAFLVQQMVCDLNFPVAIEVVPTVRAADGLALSSRNRYLKPAERRAALALSVALAAAASEAGHGVAAALSAAHAVLTLEPAVKLDYLVAVNPHTFLPVDGRYRGQARLLLAARVGRTRLIDNDTITIPSERPA
ncbi:MAG: pantoate--beta-alanine ligase [Microbacteriaceae bacterium]